MQLNFTHPPHTARGAAQRGLTLVEMLVAALILGVALMGLIGTWTYMLRTSLNTNDQTGAYQCGRLVLERAQSNGYRRIMPQTTSSPDTSGSVESTWSSPSIAAYRFFSKDAVELQSTPDNTLTPAEALQNAETAQAGAPPDIHYLVKTTVIYSDPNLRPQSRPDLTLMTISVSVYLVKPDKTLDNPNTPLYSVQTCLTQGGIS